MNLRIRLHRAAALALLPLLALTACGSGDTDGTAPAGAQAAPKDDPVADVRTVDSIAALLPADVRKAGTLRVGSSVGFPPGAYYPNGTDKEPEGQDIDIADAVAKVLGLELQRQDASFETILPALGSGKYDVGTELVRLSRLASGLVKERCADSGDAAGVVPDGFGNAVPLQDFRACGLRVAGQLLVEAKPGADQAVLWEVGNVRPGQLHGPAARNQAQALVAAPALTFRVRQAELLDFTDGARREAVAADLLARETGFLQHGDFDAGPGQVISGGGPGGARADNQCFHRQRTMLRRSLATGPLCAAMAAAAPSGPDPSVAAGLNARWTATMPPVRLR